MQTHARILTDRQTQTQTHTCQVNEVEAAMCPDASHIVQAIHNHGQHAVGAAAPLVHLGLSNRAVALTQLHHFQHILCACHLDLQ